MAGSAEQYECFVDADEAARFLSITRRRVLDLVRAGHVPGHPIGTGATARLAIPVERARGGAPRP